VVIATGEERLEGDMGSPEGVSNEVHR